MVAAAFREGIGCVVLDPARGLSSINSLPRLSDSSSHHDLAAIPWPMGDAITKVPLATGINVAALEQVSNWAFQRKTPEQDTLSLLIVHKGKIVHERYAPGIDMHTRTRTWSTAKSIAVSLIGMLVDEGKMSLDSPLGIDWLPTVLSPETDPRHAITLRHVLNMSSGLDPVDSFRMEYATGSGLSYWAGASSVDGARRRSIVCGISTIHGGSSKHSSWNSPTVQPK